MDLSQAGGMKPIQCNNTNMSRHLIIISQWDKNSCKLWRMLYLGCIFTLLKVMLGQYISFYIQ